MDTRGMAYQGHAGSQKWGRSRECFSRVELPVTGKNTGTVVHGRALRC